MPKYGFFIVVEATDEKQAHNIIAEVTGHYEYLHVEYATGEETN